MHPGNFYNLNKIFLYCKQTENDHLQTPMFSISGTGKDPSKSSNIVDHLWGGGGIVCPGEVHGGILCNFVG